MGSSPVGCTTTFHYYKSDVPVRVSIVRARTYSVHNRIAYYCTIGAHRFHEHSTYISTAFLDISLVCPLRLCTTRTSQYCIEPGFLIRSIYFYLLISLIALSVRSRLGWLFGSRRTPSLTPHLLKPARMTSLLAPLTNIIGYIPCFQAIQYTTRI